jgi:hypothetical protein
MTLGLGLAIDIGSLTTFTLFFLSFLDIRVAYLNSLLVMTLGLSLGIDIGSLTTTFPFLFFLSFLDIKVAHSML